MATALAAVEIPHIAKGQKIADYKRVYSATTTLLTDAQKRAYLPVYLNRSEGEKNIAFQAAEKATLDDAFKFLEELIDGSPCIITECEKFFSLKPSSCSTDSIRSYFFQLNEQAKRAEIKADVFIKRFLTNIPGGKKLYKDKKDDITDEMTNAQVITFFKAVLEKLQKRQKAEHDSPDIKTEPFTFQVEEEEAMPSWARDLQREVGCLRSRMESSESGFQEEDVETQLMYPFQAGNQGKEKKRCHVCNKTGHLSKSCFKRVCQTCSGTGHDAAMCPSTRSFSKRTQKFSAMDKRSR